MELRWAWPQEEGAQVGGASWIPGPGKPERLKLTICICRQWEMSLDVKMWWGYYRELQKLGSVGNESFWKIWADEWHESLWFEESIYQWCLGCFCGRSQAFYQCPFSLFKLTLFLSFHRTCDHLPEDMPGSLAALCGHVTKVCLKGCYGKNVCPSSLCPYRKMYIIFQ